MAAVLLAGLSAHADKACDLPLKTAGAAQTTPHRQLDRQDFDRLADRLEADRDKLAAILAAVDNRDGADYEINQAIKTLRGVRFHEWNDLRQIEGLHSVSVFGPQNLPLYSLILHAIMPSAVGAKVWYRVPAATAASYAAILSLLRGLSPLAAGIQLVPASMSREAFIENHASRSNMVINTGDRETGDLVKDELAKAVAGGGGFDKIIFLRFGSGLNPVILTELGKKQLGAAVDSAIEAIRINSAQDAIAPKFYAVHNLYIDSFVNQLKRALKPTQFSANDNRGADYAELAAFKAKWSRYCVTPEAAFDAGSGRVDPHVFVFPFNKFGEVDLVDHRAPFLVVFKYQSNKQLEEIAADPRVRSRALYASLYSDPSSLEMYDLKKMFEDNFHSVILNQTAYAAESGNFPFGGYSGDASQVTVLAHNQAPRVFNRPILFSCEASREFAARRRNSPAAYARFTSAPAEPENVARLTELLTAAADPNTAAALPGDWPNLKDPVMKLRPTGLAALQEAIAKGGLHIVIDGKSPKQARQAKENVEFYGADLLYAADNRSGEPLHVPGLVLHFSETTREVQLLNSYRGDVNPHLGYGYLRKLMESKYGEYVLANAVVPGSMPGSKRYSELADHAGYQALETSRLNLLKRLDQITTQGVPALANKNQLIGAIAAHVKMFFAIANEVYREGAFVKNYQESSTGDLGNQITTFSQNERNYAVQFVDRLMLGLRGDRGEFSGDKFVGYIMKNGYYETGSKMITQLLIDPAPMLIQQRVLVAKTDFGFPMEFRVDFLDGTAINSTPRYSHEYLGPEAREAEAALNAFFAQAPQAVKMLSGGADLLKLQNGLWVIIEWNIGSESGFMDASSAPIPAHLYISRLQGHRTPLLNWLDGVFAQGVKAQRNLLLSRKVKKDDFYDKESVKDISLAEIAHYYRDRYLEEWEKNPTAESGKQTLDQIRQMFNGVGGEGNRDLPLLLAGAENFISRTLDATQSLH